MYVCICMGVTTSQIQECCQKGAKSVDDITEQTGAGSCCGGCREHLTMQFNQSQSVKPNPFLTISKPKA